MVDKSQFHFLQIETNVTYFTTFGLDPVIQKRDPIFHNANSAVLKKVLKDVPFDSKTPHIEDRLWGYDIISKGYYLYYQPKASVFHYHGIHHDDDPIRRSNIVKILKVVQLAAIRNIYIK